MTAVYLVLFVAGLLLAVRFMLFGVERPVAFGARPPEQPILRMWAPIAAAFMVVFGVSGYLLSRPGRMALLAATAIAIGLGAIASLGAIRLVRRAAAFVPEHDPDDPRYVLQGHVATVLRAITDAGPGEIAYVVEGARHVVPARGLDGATAEAGAEVVIERLDETGTAWVEPWSSVEQRI